MLHDDRARRLTRARCANRDRTGRRLLTLLVVAPSCGLAGGCFALPDVPVRPPAGMLVTNVSAPLDAESSGAPLGAQSHSVSTFFIREPYLGTTWAFGDASLERALASPRLETVSHADYTMLQVLGIFGHFKITVYGDGPEVGADGVVAGPAVTLTAR